jgi:single-strand DNA-binding protein
VKKKRVKQNQRCLTEAGFKATTPPDIPAVDILKEENMADLNHVVLIGRLTRDAELKYTANGQAVCKFSIAVNRRRKNGDQWVDEANFFDIVVWGRQGESLNQYLVKGKTVGIDGELRQDRWEQDGQNRSKVEIMAGNVQLLSSGLEGRRMTND